MKKIASSVLCLAVLLWAGPAQAAADNLIISQVQITGGSGHTSDDFIELYNPTEAAINLNGLRLVKRTASGSTDTSIKSWTADILVPAHDYFLWANSGFAGISLTPDATTTATIANDNGIALRQGPEDTGTILDSVAWGTSNNGFTNVSPANPDAGQALVRDITSDGPIFSISASNPHNSLFNPAPVPDISDATSTATSTQDTTDQQTSTTQADNNQQPLFSSGGSQSEILTQSPNIKFNEIYPNPVGDDSGNEQIELVNVGGDTVNVGGWWLADSGGLKSSSFQLPSLILAPGGVVALTVPKGTFALNNSSGDTANLYFADKTLADSVSYSDSAPEGQSYQKINGAWLWGTPSLGVANVAPVTTATSNVASSSSGIFISELFPNPVSSDDGKEWVELYNSTSGSVSVKNYLLDDNATPSANALIIGNQEIPANGYVVINIPEDSFDLTNTSDKIYLFNPAKQIIDSVNYTNAPEGQSYSKLSNGQWQFTPPTPGAANLAQLPSYQLMINELLPKPAGNEDEFLELYNATSTAVNLKNFVLAIGTKTKTFTDDTIVPANGYLVLYADDLPTKLRNSGQSVTLIDNFGQTVSKVTYDKAEVGQAYALDGKGYGWTELPTPGSHNQMVLAAATDAQAADLTTKSSDKASASNVSAASMKKLIAENESLTKKVDALQASIDQLSLAMANSVQAAPVPAALAAAPADVSADHKSLQWWYLIGSLVGALAAVLLIKKYLWK